MGEREADWDPRINFTSEFKRDKSRNLPEKVPSSEFQEMLSEERMDQEIFLIKKKKISSCVPRRDHSIWLSSVWLLHFGIDLSTSCPLSRSTAVRPKLM